MRSARELEISVSGTGSCNFLRISTIRRVSLSGSPRSTCVSDGRVEFGTGEAGSEAELGGFGVERSTKRDQWTEAIDVIARMLVEEPFAGHKGAWINVPPCNVVPKPLQKPHPPLWVACSRRETIHLAATKGIGALLLFIRRGG